MRNSLLILFLSLPFLSWAGNIQNDDFSSLSGWSVLSGNSINESASHSIRSVDTTSRSNHNLQSSSAGVSLPSGDTLSLLQTVAVDPGFYDLTVVVSRSNNSGNSYAFGQGTGYTMASTMIPVATGQSLTDTIYVRGIGTTDGKISIGVYNDGTSEIKLSKVSLTAASAYNFLQGGDITELNYVLDAGGVFSDTLGNPLTSSSASREENAQSVCNYLSQRGWNFCRIRETNNPGLAHPDNTNTWYLPDGYQDVDDCVLLAQAAQAAGMQIQFTLNWSDFWSNGSRQNVPADWLDSISGLSSSAITTKLASCCYWHTKKVMQRLAALNIYPAYVSLGNEINGGLLFPYGYSYDVSSSAATSDMPEGSANWSAIAAFINAGYKAVKEVSPSSQVVVHLADQTYDAINTDLTGHVDWYIYSWFFDALKSYGASYDVIGASYYPSWSTATAKEAASYFKMLMNRYDKNVLVMETGYNFDSTDSYGYKGQLPYTAESYKTMFPFTPDGQKGFLAEVFNSQKSCGSGSQHHIIGDLYWDPVMIHLQDSTGTNLTGWAHLVATQKADNNVVANTTQFDFSGKALPVLDAYSFNRNAQSLTLHSASLASAVGGSGSFSAVGGSSVEDGSSYVNYYYGDSLSLSFNTSSLYQLDSVLISSPSGSTSLLFAKDSLVAVQGLYSSSFFSFSADSLQVTLSLSSPDANLTFTPYYSLVDHSAVASVVADKGLVAYSSQGQLIITSTEAAQVQVSNSFGQTIAVRSLSAGGQFSLFTGPGIYGVNHLKVIVR